MTERRLSKRGRAVRPGTCRAACPEPGRAGELPLFARAADGPPAPRTRKLPLPGALAIGGAAAALALTIAWPPAPRLVWNASASAPVGLYLVRPGATLERGDMVVAWLPRPMRRLAAERRYLPFNVPAVKRLAAVSGQRVCANGAHVSIDGRRAATRLLADRLGRPLPAWQGCRTLRADEVFLLMEGSRDSFDGRYAGITRAADIVGKARLLWSPGRQGASEDGRRDER